MKPTEFHCQVKSFKTLTPTVFQTTFETDKPLPFKAGQFISIVIPGAGPKGRDLRRAYSIASPPENPQIELCIKIVEGGPGTTYLNRLRPGDQFRGFAPYGDFVYEPKTGRNVCFIATGTGLAPFRAMALSEEFQMTLPQKSFCLLGVRTEDELIFQEEFEKIPGMKFVPTVSKPQGQWSGFVGRVTDYLRSLKDHEFPWSETEFYLCGNGGMITEVKSILTEKGVNTDSIHQEIYYK